MPQTMTAEKMIAAKDDCRKAADMISVRVDPMRFDFLRHRHDDHAAVPCAFHLIELNGDKPALASLVVFKHF